MEAKLTELQEMADALANAIDDAMNMPSIQRRKQMLSQAKSIYSELSSKLHQYPFVSGDLRECLNEIQVLEQNGCNVFLAVANGDITFEQTEQSSKRHFDRHNHLGKAAAYSAAAQSAMLNKDFDACWAALELEKSEYLLHAEYHEWNVADTMRLFASVNRKSANLLRKEKRHVDALRHLLYYLTHSAEKSQASIKLLGAYLNRAKLPGATLVSALALIDRSSNLTDFEEIDAAIRNWSRP